jgi:hypothetical protein
LTGDLTVEAGQFVYNRKGKPVSKAFQHIFQVVPVVMAAVTTFNDPAAVTVRLNKISYQDFSIRLQEQEANNQDHGNEMISYIAWQPSSGNFNGILFEVNNTDRVVNHKFSATSFTQPHTAEPVFLVQMQSIFGGNPANVTWRNKDIEGVEVSIAEETSLDAEKRHTMEILGFMAFSLVQ